jgi:putative addiction module killer protein
VSAILTTAVFDGRCERLRDRRAAACIHACIDRAESGNLGDCSPVDEGVSETRIDYGPGCRPQFVQRGDEVIVLPVGGRSTQAREIDMGKELPKQP